MAADRLNRKIHPAGRPMKKQEVLSLLDHFPDEVDTEELMHRLYLKEKLRRAEEAIAARDVLSSEEVATETEQWFPSNGPVQP